MKLLIYILGFIFGFACLVASWALEDAEVQYTLAESPVRDIYAEKIKYSSMFRWLALFCWLGCLIEIFLLLFRII